MTGRTPNLTQNTWQLLARTQNWVLKEKEMLSNLYVKATTKWTVLLRLLSSSHQVRGAILEVHHTVSALFHVGCLSVPSTSLVTVHHLQKWQQQSVTYDHQFLTIIIIIHDKLIQCILAIWLIVKCLVLASHPKMASCKIRDLAKMHMSHINCENVITIRADQ